MSQGKEPMRDPEVIAAGQLTLSFLLHDYNTSIGYDLKAKHDGVFLYLHLNKENVKH